MSMAAMRIFGGKRDGRVGRGLACYIDVIYCSFGRSEPHPTMNRSLPLVSLLERRARALRRQLSAAIAGTDVGVHQARVASRRLREALPVLTAGLQHTKPGKAQRKIRR